MSLTTRIEAAWTRGGPLQWALRPLAVLLGGLAALRRALYRRGWRRVVRAPVPVVVVGNRIVGGAGKTPVTLALVDALRAAGWRPGIVSRGHGGSGGAPRPVPADGNAATAREVGDEPLLMQRRSGVPVWVGRDRGAAALALCAAHPDTDVLVCDDGLQHLRLARDIECVVFDARGAGNGWLLPAGPLREPIDLPVRMPQWVLYNAERASTPLPGLCLRAQPGGLVDLAGWWRGAAASADAWERLAARARAAAPHQRPIASAGIGQPGRFFASLGARGLPHRAWPLPDHDPYTTLPWPDVEADLVITEKDAVKLDPERLARERPRLRIWVAPLALSLPPELTGPLLAALHGAAQALRPGATSR